VYVHEFSDMDSGVAAYDDNFIQVFALTKPAFDYQPPQSAAFDKAVDDPPLPEDTEDVTCARVSATGRVDASSSPLSKASGPLPVGAADTVKSDAACSQEGGARGGEKQGGGTSSDNGTRAQASIGEAVLSFKSTSQLHAAERGYGSDGASLSASDVDSETGRAQGHDASSLETTDESSSEKSSLPTASSESADTEPEVRF
jgi:hypothetical protein